MDQFLRGAIVAGCLVVGLFFLRFHRRTSDRLFLFFALSFFLLSAERFMLAVLASYHVQGFIGNIPYWVRAVAYLILIWGIVDKNLARRTGGDLP
jgi:hypothetical protein